MTQAVRVWVFGCLRIGRVMERTHHSAAETRQARACDTCLRFLAMRDYRGHSPESCVRYVRYSRPGHRRSPHPIPAQGAPHVSYPVPRRFRFLNPKP